MSSLTLDSIAVDCPDPGALAQFYGALFNVEAHDDYVKVLDGRVEIWFQQVENYQPPTWPTQERGQQVHFDLITNNIDAAALHAESVGARRAPVSRESDNFLVMIDPVGHPFCLCKPWSPIDSVVSAAKKSETMWIELGQITLDCPDDQVLGEFYARLLDVSPLGPDGEAIGIVADTGVGIYLQQVETYAGPSWPTQERGQQIHIDFHTADRDEHVARAVDLGAKVAMVEGSFTVMRDPAGHPFCICNASA